MNLSELEIIAREAARTALAMHRTEAKQKQKKEIQFNTNKLLTRYFDIKDYLKTAHCHFRIGDEEIILKGIFRSKATTKFLMQHVDLSIGVLSVKHRELGHIIKTLYTDGTYRDTPWEEKIQLLADELQVSVRTILRRRSDAVNELSLILFGADGIKLWII